MIKVIFCATTIALAATAILGQSTCISLDPPPTDVFFLADSTGSMSAAMSSFKGSEISIVNGLNAYAKGAHVGIAEFRDVGDFGGNSTWRTNLPIGAHSSSAVAAATASWAANGGGDLPEAHYEAIFDLATNTSNWRAGSVRYIVLITDIYSHNPAGHAEITAEQCNAALRDNKIQLIVLDVSTYKRAKTLGLDTSHVTAIFVTGAETGAAAGCAVANAGAKAQYGDSKIPANVCGLEGCEKYLGTAIGKLSDAGSVAFGFVATMLVVVVAVMLF